MLTHISWRLKLRRAKKDMEEATCSLILARKEREVKRLESAGVEAGWLEDEDRTIK